MIFLKTSFPQNADFWCAAENMLQNTLSNQLE